MIDRMKEGWRMLQRARRVRRTGFKRYTGAPEDMCRAIIADAFDKRQKYFRVSSGHFCEFYVRDFAFCADALVALGYKKEVRATLRYALRQFKKGGKISAILTPDGAVYEFPSPGPDSLALFLFTISQTNPDLAAQHKKFLQDQVTKFADTFVDDGLPKKGNWSSIRDHTQRDRCCYDAIMIAVVAREARKFGLKFPWTLAQVKKRILEEYWNGTYFFSDLRKQSIVIADANIFPFWTGVFSGKRMREQAMTAVQAAGLSAPYPLRYVSTLDKKRERSGWHFTSLFVPGYETDAIWMHLGLVYLALLQSLDRKKTQEYLRQYTGLLKLHGTFLEVYDREGEPYSTPFYVTDEAMIWCASYLHLAKKLKVIR